MKILSSANLKKLGVAFVGGLAVHAFLKTSVGKDYDRKVSSLLG